MNAEEEDFLDDDPLNDDAPEDEDGSGYRIEGINGPHRPSPPPADDNYDIGRYDSARGWEPENPHKKRREAHRKRHPEIFCDESMLQTRPARDCHRLAASGAAPSQELFGNLWRTGELAVLFAESGSGKSILAIQIAESIARGKRMETGDRRQENGAADSPVSRLVSPVSPAQHVLYLDLERSDQQFSERYSRRSPIPGKLPVRYGFSPKLRRTSYGATDIPEAFNGNFNRYFRHSLGLTLSREASKIIIIDNLTCLDPCATGAAPAIRRLRSLKLYAAENAASILVITHAKLRPNDRRTRHSSPVTRPLSLGDIAPSPQIAEIADTVFAIGRSTFDPDIRYIKHLKSNSTEINYGPSNTLVYRLERSEGPARAVNGEREQVNGSTPSLFLPVSGLPSLVSALSPVFRLPSPVSPAGPFLGFTYLGPSSESDLLRDYEAEYREAERREMARIKKARTLGAREALVAGILNGDYARYLKG